MNYKKLLAASLAATMVLGNAVVAFAENQEGGSTGEGETQYVEENDVFDVVFPTTADNATTFNYWLDPDGLIKTTSGDRYTGKAFDDDKTVYFLRSTKVDGTIGGTAGTANCDYTDKSDEIKVVNKSTQAVDLKVTAKVTPVDGIKMATNNTFPASGEGASGTSTDTELYLALLGTDGTTPTEKAITAEGVELTANIAEDPDAYTVKWVAATGDEPGHYKRELTDEAKAADYDGFQYYSFQLTGKCNTGDDVDWSGLKENAPKVDLVWSVEDFTVTGPQMTATSGGLITISNLTVEQNKASSVTITVGDQSWPIDASAIKYDTSNWDAENGGEYTIQLGTAWLNLIAQTGSATVTLTIPDDITRTATITM